MKGSFLTARRRRAAGAAAVLVLGAAGIVWFATRGTGQPAPRLIPAGPPVTKGDATYVPVQVPGSPPGKVAGYGLAVSGAAATALKSGKTVVVPGPTGGTIEIRAVEPTPPPPGGRK